MKVKIIKIENGYNGHGGLVGKICWVKCNWCNKIMRIGYYRAKSGRGKFCSKDCCNQYLKTLCRDTALHWKGGKTIENGYVLIYIPTHPFANSSGYVRKHRLVMEKHLSRYLKSKEIVHHINRIKDDNRLRNLKIMKTSDHLYLHRCFLKSLEISLKEMR